jgi:hypothetical protein
MIGKNTTIIYVMMVLPFAVADDDDNDVSNLVTGIFVGICSEYETCSYIMIWFSVVTIIILIFGCMIGCWEFPVPSGRDICTVMIGGFIGKGIGKKFK